QAGAKAGDVFDMDVGGRLDESAGDPIRVTGTIYKIAQVLSGRHKDQMWYMIAFGGGNLLILSPYLAQVQDPQELWNLGLEPDDFDIVAVKSRVHFRRGFDDSGYAPTILLVEPPEPFMGTVRLDALKYEHLSLTDYYPYGDPVFDCKIL